MQRSGAILPGLDLRPCLAAAVTRIRRLRSCLSSTSAQASRIWRAVRGRSCSSAQVPNHLRPIKTGPIALAGSARHSLTSNRAILHDGSLLRFAHPAGMCGPRFGQAHRGRLHRELDSERDHSQQGGSSPAARRARGRFPLPAPILQWRQGMACISLQRLMGRLGRCGRARSKILPAGN